MNCCCALPRFTPTRPVRQSSEKSPGPPRPGLTTMFPRILLRANVFQKKVDNRGRTKGAMKEKNVLLHSCHRAGVEPNALSWVSLPITGFPHQELEAPVPPPSPGFSYDGLGISVSSEGGLGGGSGALGCASVPAPLAEVRVLSSIPGSSHLQSGAQKNDIKLMALTSQTACARNELS